VGEVLEKDSRKYGKKIKRPMILTGGRGRWGKGRNEVWE